MILGYSMRTLSRQLSGQSAPKKTLHVGLRDINEDDVLATIRRIQKRREMIGDLWPKLFPTR